MITVQHTEVQNNLSLEGNTNHTLKSLIMYNKKNVYISSVFPKKNM